MLSQLSAGAQWVGRRSTWALLPASVTAVQGGGAAGNVTITDSTYQVPPAPRGGKKHVRRQERRSLAFQALTLLRRP